MSDNKNTDPISIKEDEESSDITEETADNSAAYTEDPDETADSVITAENEDADDRTDDWDNEETETDEDDDIDADEETENDEEDDEDVDDEEGSDEEAGDEKAFGSVYTSYAYKAQSESSTAQKRRFVIQTPLVIAALILLFTVLFFVLWGLFTNKGIIGSWVFTHKIDDTEYHTTLTFTEDSVKYYSGGVTYTGKYSLSKEDNKDILQIKLSRYGVQALDAKFYYEAEGSTFSGRTLKLTDLNGFLLPPDNISSQNEQSFKEKSSIADYIEENGVRYYVFEFEPTEAPDPVTVPIKNAKKDKDLVGIWYEENKDSGYSCTFCFNDDGTYSINYIDISYDGCYSAEKDSCTYNLSDSQGNATEQTFKYTIKGDDLTLDFETFTSKLVRTNDKYAFRSAIK